MGTAAETYEWFLNERGITENTLDSCSVEIDEEGTVAFNYTPGIKYRRGFGKEDREFWWEKGSKAKLYTPVITGNGIGAFLCEGESDTLRLIQETGFSLDVKGLSGVASWKPEFSREFDGIDTVWVILDNDPDYNVKGTVDTEWHKIKADLPQAKRVYLPEDVKDVCEFFDKYTIDTLRTLTNKKHYKWDTLDFSAKPPEYDWLLKDFIARGDVTLLVGDPNAGKSMLAFDLCIAIANGDATWMGKELKSPGKVLYVDQENPVDVVLHRAKNMGLTAEGFENIRYYHFKGIRVDQEPRDLIEEALEFEPSVIVLDSLTRFHRGEENDNGYISAMFTDGITPLARETGAAVLVIHHTNKGESTDSYKRTRGARDIGAVVDTAFDMRVTDTDGGFSLTHFKSRRRRNGDQLFGRIVQDQFGMISVVPGIRGGDTF